jgi:hypothetical protein
MTGRESRQRGTVGALLAIAAMTSSCGGRFDVGGPVLLADGGSPVEARVATDDAAARCCGAGETFGGAACTGCCSGLMSVSDGGSSGTCELPYRKVLLVMTTAGALAATDPQNYRVDALNTLLQGYTTATSGPETKVAVLAFASSIEQLPIGDAFTSMPDLGQIDELVSQSDNQCDYDGALRSVTELLATAMMADTADQRAQTSYAVVFFSDELPAPICNALTTTCGPLTCPPHQHCVPTTLPTDGGLHESYECANDYDLCTVPKSEWASAFNPPISSSLYPALMANQSYNTTPQLVADVGTIMALKSAYGVGELTLSTIFLFNESALSGSLAAPFQLDGPAPEALLQAMAKAGGGSFVEFTDPSKLTFATTPSLQ